MPNTTDDQQDLHLPTIGDYELCQDVMLFTLFSGFAAVVAYIMCEQAPCHASPWAERIFLSSVAFCLLLVLCGMYFVVWDPVLDFQTQAKDVTVLFVNMMQLFYDNNTPELSQFKGPQPAARSNAAEQLGQAIIMAMDEVDAPIHLIPSMSSGRRTPPIVRQMLPFFMFLMILRLMLHPQGKLRNIVSAFQWFGVFLIVLTWFLNFTRYVCKKRKKQRQLIGLVWQVIEHGSAKQVLPMLHCPLLLQQIGDTQEVVKWCGAATSQLGGSGKAALIDAVAKNGLSWGWIPRSRDRQELVVRIVESSLGRELTKLKNYLDMSGDVFNLVYICEQLSTRNQFRLHQHVDREAKRVERRQAGKAAAPPPRRLKVLSDIDDTLQSSGGHFPKGCDKEWPHAHCYPGVLAFYRRLDCCAGVASSEGHAADSLQSTKSVMVLPKDWCPGRGNLQAPLQASLTSPTNVAVQLPELYRSAAACDRRCRRASGLSRRTANASEPRPWGTVAKAAGAAGEDGEAPRTQAAASDEPEAAGGSADAPVIVRISSIDECNLVFLSARPHVHKDVAEAASYRVFWELVRDRRVHTVPSLLPGSLRAGLKALLCARCSRSAWRAAGLKKFASFEAYARLWPEYRFVFIGDNGQADVLVAELIMANYSNAAACFIHEVQPLPLTLTSLEATTLQSWGERRIYFFRSYIGAALAALEAGLLGPADVAEVASEAVDDFEAEISKRSFLNISRMAPGESNARRLPPEDHEGATGAVLAQLKADLQRANAVLRAKQLPEVEFPDRAQRDEGWKRYTTATPEPSRSWWDLEDAAADDDAASSDSSDAEGAADTMRGQPPARTSRGDVELSFTSSLRGSSAGMAAAGARDDDPEAF